MFALGAHGAGLALSPSGRLLAVAQGGGVDVLDLDARARRFRAERPDASIKAVAFSPDEARVAVGFVPASSLGGGEASVRLFDVESGREAQRLEGAWVYATSLTFSPDGARLQLVGSCLCLWSAVTGKLVRELTAPNDLREASFSADGRVAIGLAVPPVSHTIEPDGTHIYFAQRHRLLRWDADAITPRTLLESDTEQHLALTPDGARMLVTRREAPGVEVRSLQDGSVVAARKEPASAGALSPDGQTAAVAGLDSRIRLLSWPDLRSTGTLEGHAQWEVDSLAFSRDGRRLVSATMSEILVWEAR
jgi:WD40 repeat protein